MSFLLVICCLFYYRFYHFNQPAINIECATRVVGIKGSILQYIKYFIFSYLFLISVNCVTKLVWDFPRLCGIGTLIKFYLLFPFLSGQLKLLSHCEEHFVTALCMVAHKNRK